MVEHNASNRTRNGFAAAPDSHAVIAPSAPEQLPSLLGDIESHAKAYTGDDPDARLKLVDAAQSLVQSMETPRETMLRYCWANVKSTAFASIETGVQLGVFSHLAQSDEPKTVAELAKATGADVNLLGRILKHLAAMGVIVEAGQDEYRRNGLFTALAAQRFSDSWPCINGSTTPAVLALPLWLRRNQHRTPSDSANAPFNLGFRTELHFFDFINANPDYPAVAAQFNNLMSSYHEGKPSWMEVGFYPVQDRLIQGARHGRDEALLVDVGGNKGHDLEEFLSKWPDSPGRLILQDLPHVINDAVPLHPSIEPMVHDFFTEQPVKGARAYFLHSVLHDWTDEICQKILARIAAAMEPGYSRLLIHENVIPNTRAHWQATSLDIVMMAVFAAKERTEVEWRQMVEAVGLRISGIWGTPGSSDSVVECEVAEG